MVQSRREPRPFQAAAQCPVLQAHLGGDIPVLLPVAFEDPLGPELHAASLHLDEQKVAGLVGDHDVDLTVPFGSRRPDAAVDAVKDRERFGQPRSEAMYDVEPGGQPGRMGIEQGQGGAELCHDQSALGAAAYAQLPASPHGIVFFVRLRDQSSRHAQRAAFSLLA